MDFEELCEQYREQLITANGRVFELEKSVAAQIREVKQLKAQLMATQSNLHEVKSRVAELEDSDGQGHPVVVKGEYSDDASINQQRMKELETENAHFTRWVDGFETSTGVDLRDAAEEITKLRAQVDNASGIEKALRTQLKNSEKQAAKANGDIVKAENKLAKCQDALQTQKANVKRAQMFCNTPTKQDDTSSPQSSAKGGQVGTPYTPPSKKTRLWSDQDDDEENCKGSPPSARQTSCPSLKRRLGGSA